MLEVAPRIAVPFLDHCKVIGGVPVTLGEIVSGSPVLRVIAPGIPLIAGAETAVTVRVAVAVVAEPAELVAAHRNWSPFIPAVALVMVSVDVPVPE